jgi:SAM-dependent methyltransferase
MTPPRLVLALCTSLALAATALVPPAGSSAVPASAAVTLSAPQQPAPAAPAPLPPASERRAFWNKEFEEGKALLQKDAAPLLVAAVQGRTPGTALDLGMGEGRNALHLAAQGWTVTGVDLADVAIAQALDKARARGLTLDGIVADLDVYDMGTAQWDLITSFYMHAWHRRSSTDVPARILRALKPGGLLVIEGFADPPNTYGFVPATLDEAFARLRILRNERVVDAAAWYVEEKTPLVRFVAEKPRH